MEAAGWRCQCPGTCGAVHATHDAPCVHGHRTATLSIAPADLTLSDVQAARVPQSSLLVWCDDCRRATAAHQRKAQHRTAPTAVTATETLF